jgi:DNA polymerase I-like protein with 3'-5' exonuclease and polymerase domains
MARRYYAYDSETVPFGPGDMAPELVCVQFQELATLADPSTRHLVTKAGGALAHVKRLLDDPDVVLVGHNIAYDMAVLVREGLVVEVFRAYREGRVLCTWVFERLGEIAGLTTRKNLSVDGAMAAHGVPVPEVMNAKVPDGRLCQKKNGAWEPCPLSVDFGRFLHETEIRSELHRDYALTDLLVGKLFQRQYQRFARDVPLSAVALVSRTQFWLQLMSVWGLRTDADLVAAFRDDVVAQLAELRELFTQPDDVQCECGQEPHDEACPLAGYFVRPDGSCMVKDRLQPAIVRAYDGRPPLTPPSKKFPQGQPQRSALVLESSGNPRLQAFAHYSELVKAESADVPMLERGWLHPRYGLADTCRTTCSDPNAQNLPGAGLVRQCIQPAPGFAFLERDYSGVELCTFAALGVRLLGDSSMADQINQSGDPGFMHAVLGGQLLGVTPQELLRRRKAGDELAENARTRAKNANFGFMGGMGYRKYVDYVRALSKGKIVLTLEESKALREAWATAVPVGPKYHEYVASTERYDGSFEAEIPYLGVKRRNLWYTAACNTPFQGWAAAIMHEAGWRLAEACYLPGGALVGVHPALFVHDSFTLETPDAPDDLTEVDVIFERILDEAAAHVMPEVRTKSEGHAAYSLAKRVNGQKVGRVTDNRGRLLVWTAREKEH